MCFKNKRKKQKVNIRLTNDLPPSLSHKGSLPMERRDSYGIGGGSLKKWRSIGRRAKKVDNTHLGFYLT